MDFWTPLVPEYRGAVLSTLAVRRKEVVSPKTAILLGVLLAAPMFRAALYAFKTQSVFFLGSLPLRADQLAIGCVLAIFAPRLPKISGYLALAMVFVVIVERAQVQSGAGRSFWRAVTLKYLFTHPRSLRAAGRLLRLYQRSGLEATARKTGLLRLMPASLRRLEPQAPRVAPVFSTR